MTSRPDLRTRGAVRSSIAVLCLVAGAWTLAACGSDASSDGASGDGGSSGQLEGLVRSPAMEVGDVSLPDVSEGEPGTPFAFKAEPGKLLFVTFGYTNCPDVCPTTLSDLKKAKAKADPDDKVDAAFVTIDPERDTADVITPYLGSFVEGGHPLRTMDLTELEAAKDAFGVKSSVTKTPEGDVEVTHSARSFVVDENGKVVVEWAFGTGSDGMANDLEILLDKT